MNFFTLKKKVQYTGFLIREPLFTTEVDPATIFYSIFFHMRFIFLSKFVRQKRFTGERFIPGGTRIEGDGKQMTNHTRVGNIYLTYT